MKEPAEKKKPPKRKKKIKRRKKRSKYASKKRGVRGGRGRSKGKVADLSQVGALGKLGGMGLFSKKARKTSALVAAASNLDAVRTRGGVQTFSVSGIIEAMPGKGVRLARISSVKTRGGTPQGDGYGVASVGKKQKTKG